ncbi:chloramphenicol acetyltransferase [Methylobacterium sp. Leaf465]|jgi:phosphonate metabolism protein (transferase hexapeptide repeat family)|uniref:DapH/DapD/GlmU-related protein n=1 Tax=Methylobacterium sp. Leaf465 TaxID=1736385 RepID=UPI0006FFE8A1|nr:DapH/DapD/GlmU-related protein [Methylobacterium sp. Leaf465]KQT82306.1 chloramphenicol acetyltransferase [Methylobacterium sp. Leaf465]
MVSDRLGLEPAVHPTAELSACRLGRYTEVGARTRLSETHLDDYTYIVEDGQANHTTIGKFCSIASHVRINPGNHPMERASQSHFTYRAGAYWPGEERDEPAFFARRRALPVRIGHDVWIGHGAVILAGRTIGTGAVVGAGTIVTRDVAPYTVVVGNPGRVVRRRFPEAIAERLLALAWWDWDHARLRRALPDFRALSIDAFLERYEAEA